MQYHSVTIRFFSLMLLCILVGCGSGDSSVLHDTQDKLTATDPSKANDTTLPLGFDLPAYARFGERQVAQVIDADRVENYYGYQVGSAIRLFNEDGIALQQVDPEAWLDYYVNVSVQGTNRNATFQLSANPSGVNALVTNLYTYQNGATFVLQLLKKLADGSFELQDITKIVAPSVDSDTFGEEDESTI